MTRKDLTDRFLRSVKAAPTGKRVILYDAQIPGFGLRITDKSSELNRGSFVLVARYPGSRNPTPRRIGDFPAMSLASARQIARDWRECLSQQPPIDPKLRAAEQARDEQRRKADTFRAVFESYAADHLATLRTGKGAEAAIKKHVMPRWSTLPLTSIKRSDVTEVIRLTRQDAPIVANRILAYLKHFFGWAIDQDLIDSSPAFGVRRPSKETKRDRVLTTAELRAIWAACGQDTSFGAAIKLMLLTAQRRSEVAGMTWAEIDLKSKVWTLSRERTKADRSHEVPLSRMAAEVIEACPKLGSYVFASRRAAGKKGGSSPISGWSKAKLRIDAAAAAHLRNEYREPQASLPEWHLHDLRRTAATMLAKLGTDRIIISKLLNHSEGGVTSIYDRHAYEIEKREALDRLAKHLTELLDGFRITGFDEPLDFSSSD